MDFRFTKKELIIIGVVIFFPILIILMSFLFGKLVLSVKRAKFQKAGIPTTIQEYNAKYYKAIPDSENALKTLEDAFLLYNDDRRTRYIYDQHHPVLDQKINPQLYALFLTVLKDNDDFYNAIKKVNKYSKVRYKCEYEKISWKISKCDFYDASRYFAARVEYAIKEQDSKSIIELLKSAFHLNTFSAQIPYASYYNDLYYCDKQAIDKFVRCLSIIDFSKSDLEFFIKIFNEHEKLNKEDLRKSYIQCIVTGFELTNRKNLEYWYQESDLRGSFFHNNENLLTICSYGSGINSYGIIKDLEINDDQKKLIGQPYCRIRAQLEALDKENQSLRPLVINIAMGRFTISRTYTAISRLRCAKTACAVELFRLKYRKLPDSLKQLVPEFLPEVPIDMFDGKELKYKYGNFEIMYHIPEFDSKKELKHHVKEMLAKKYGYYIYSVGRDLTDENGDLLNFNTYMSKDITAPVAVKMNIR